MICEPETLRRLCRIFFPAIPTSSEWCGRLADVFKEHAVDDVDVIGYFHAMSLHHDGFLPANPAVVGSVLAPFGKLEHFGSEVTLVVQANNSERWLEWIIDFYKDIGVKPVFAVDGRTSDETRRILSAKEVAGIDVGGQSRDGSMKSAFARVNTPWILFVQDDELPTPALLEFIDKAVKYSTNFVWGFPRVHCRYDASSDDLRYSQFLPFGPLAGADVQWRLFARADGPKERRSAVADAILFNFDWVARSFADRIDRLRNQEADGHSPTSLASFCLYEAIPEPWHMLAPLQNKRFEQIARLIHRSRGEK